MNSEFRHPKAYEATVNPGDAFGGSHLKTFPGSYVAYLQLTNMNTTTVQVRLNGDSNATFKLYGNTTQVFNVGDVTVTSLDFANTVSGGSASTVDVLYSVVTQ